MEHIRKVVGLTVDKVAMMKYGMTRTDALKKGICLKCRESALEKCYSDAGRREYKVSALCELCFDAIVNEFETGEDSRKEESP